MLYDLTKEIRAVLQSKGVPVSIEYGPERTQSTTFGRERIVLEEDVDAGDSFGPAISVHTNPKHRASQRLGVAVRIYAQATIVGAAVQDHRRRARAIFDPLFVAIDTILRGSRKNLWEPSSGKFLSADEFQLRGLETWSGAVYEFKFTVSRAIEDLTWVGDANPEITLGAGSIRSTTNVTTFNGPGNQTEEVACGA